MVDQVVDLDDDAAADYGLPLDELRDRRPKVGRSDEQLAVMALPAVTGEQVEQLGHVRAEVRVRGQQAHVFVAARGVRVVVAGAYMQVVLDVRALAPDDKGHLRVGLQPEQAIYDVNVCFLERPCPTYVGLLVAPSLDLDERDDLLAALGRADQGAHDGTRRTGGSVESLLDGEHIGIAGGVVDQRLDRGRERVVRVMGEDVARAQHRKQVRHLGRDSAQSRLCGRRPHLCLEIRAVELRQDEQAAHVEQAIELVHVAGLQLELTRQQLEHLCRHARVDFEANHARMTPAASQLRLDRSEEIFGVAVHIVEVAVARDPERKVTHDLHPREQRLQVQGDHIFERHVSLAFDQRDEARQHGRDLDPREPLLLALRIANHDGEVERQMGDIRKRMSRIDGQRREHWKNLFSKYGVKLGELLPAHVI